MTMLRSLILFLCLAAPALAAPPPKVTPAADGIFAAFQSHPLVGLGEWHGLAQEMDFYAVLVRDPRFANEVGNLVLEMGSAAQQGVVDRYVNGENVPYRELRKVWADTVGIFPTVQSLGTINLYAAVRAVNLGLPPQQRIKVWLGDPPIDWAQVKTKADWLPLEDQRYSYPTELIEREILAKSKKALVIYGTGHFGVFPGGLSPFPPPGMILHRTPVMRHLLDTRHPGALYVVAPYVGYTNAACSENVERHFKGITAPSLISPIKGSSLEDDVLRPGCAALVKEAVIPQADFDVAIPNMIGVHSDAFLYLGPRDAMLTSPNVPDLYLDLEFRAEVDRRNRLRLGNGLRAIPDPNYNPSVPQPYWAK